jgi:flavin-dependent dehydrogenase
MKIVIVGGGPAGCMAALTIKKQFEDYEVLIIEK